MRERIMAAARRLAAEKSLDRIGLSEVARLAGVSWPTVKRHVGTKQELRRALVGERPELAGALPDTRRRLLEAAVPVFARDGYEGATLDAIAAAAGLTKGAVYWHFEAKHELFGALLEQYASRQKDRARAVVQAASPAAQPQAAWERLLASQAGPALRGAHWSRLVLEFVSRGPRCGQHAQLREAVAVLENAAAELTQQLQQRGQASRSAEPATVGTMVSALLYGLLLAQVVCPERVNLQAVIEAAARLLARGLAPS
jgi:AcrR family transcriptional regulator